MLTPKQERNQPSTMETPANNASIAQPGPSFVSDVSMAQSTATAAGDAIAHSSDTLNVPPSSDHTEWDAGLAVDEQAGEA